MATKKLTIRDIAKMVGVSYATVSRALSGSTGISEETRKRVLEVCAQQGYTTNYMARSLVARESKLIGLIVGSVDNPFMGQLACQIELYARKRGYNLMFCNSTNQAEKEIETFSLLMGRQVDGIIIVPASANTYEELEKYIGQIPTVFVSENLRDSRVSYVAVDNYQGTYMGTEYLISLGHKSIAYMGRREGSTTHTLRGKGYQSACREHGLEAVFYDNVQFPFSSIESGYTLGKEFFASRSQRARHTAIFASTDTTALGLMQAADEFGVRIPEDYSLIGFDNISFSALPRIKLTTIDQPITAMASTAVDKIIELIQSPSVGYSHQVLPPTLIARDTCIPAGSQQKPPHKENAPK